MKKKESVPTCSLTSSLPELKSCTKIGTAPWSMTTRVCSDVPDAILVKAHAASNCIHRNHQSHWCLETIQLKPKGTERKVNKMFQGIQLATGVDHAFQETPQTWELHQL